MRILFAHNFYQQRGGEESVLENEMSLLERHGHDVRLVSVNNDVIAGTASKLRVAAKLAYDRRSELRLGDEISAFRPDLLHVHNFFPQLTPSVYWAAARHGVPVVQTLHNFRTICAGAFLFRDGRICETCVKGSPYLGAVHACYRGSRIGSLALSHMISRHRRSGTWHKMVDRFIAPSSFVREKFVEAGFPAERIVVKPHFITDDGAPCEGSRRGALFVGRLSAEKGVRMLVDQWRGIDYPLRIAGSGPLADELRSSASSQVELLGHLTGEAIRNEMQRARFLVVPSQWHEVFGMVVVEAFAAGLPVLAARTGALPDLVDDGRTGLLFDAESPADLRQKALLAIERPDLLEDMGRAARRVFVERFSADAAYPKLMAVYADAIDDASRRRA